MTSLNAYWPTVAVVLFAAGFLGLLLLFAWIFAEQVERRGKPRRGRIA